MYGFIFFRDCAWVTVIIDEYVSSVIYERDPMLTSRIIVCSTPQFQNLKNSTAQRRRYIITIRTNTTGRLAKVAKAYSLPDRGRLGKHGSRSSKRRMPNSTATTNLWKVDVRLKRLKILPGKPSLIFSKRTHLTIAQQRCLQRHPEQGPPHHSAAFMPTSDIHAF